MVTGRIRYDVPEIPGVISIESIEMLRIHHHEAVNEIRFGDLEKNGYVLLEAFAAGDIDGHSEVYVLVDLLNMEAEFFD